MQEQNAGAELFIDERSGPSGSGRFANVVSGWLHKPPRMSVKVSCKLLTTICPMKQTEIAKELNTLLYIGFEHPNICSAMDIKFDPDRVVVVFPSLDITIQDMWKNLQGILDARARFRVIFLLLDALRYLHNTLNLVHRDVKAGNVMLTREDNVQLIDFGSAQSIKPDVPLFSSTAQSCVPPPAPAFCWDDVSANPGTDNSPFLVFDADKKKDDVCGALQLLQQISGFVVNQTQPPADLDLTFTSTHDFLKNLCVYYLHKDRTIPGSEELYQIMWEKVQEDPTRIDYPSWSSDIQACLRAKACKSSSQH
jgi:serine/threonine protein kinase